jgi:hypothetical protein
MKHLKKFINFINEGAWYDNGKTYLSVKNDPNNPNELLKTVDPNNLNFSERGVANIKTYFGLYPKTPYKKGNEESRNAKKFIMEPLKNDDFSMWSGETLEDFFKYTLTNNIEGGIDYIVTIGSSKDLVGKMAQSFLNLYPKASIIPIPKIKYTNVMDAVDWEAYNRKIESELAIPRYYDKDIINKRTGEIIHRKGDEKPRSSPTMQRVEPWIDDMVKKLLQMEDPSFEIKSSGEMGGIRGALRPKYNTATEGFISAVHHCCLGDNNGNFGKMLIIDDNINQGNDLRDISNKIVEIVSGIIDITKNITEDRLKKSDILSRIETESLKNISKNIFCYALYNFGPSGKRYEPIPKFKTDLLKKSFLMAASKVMEISLDEVNKRMWKPGGFILDKPRYLMVDKSDWDMIYNELLDIAAEEYEKTSQDSKSEIRKSLKDVLDSNMDKIFFAEAIAPVQAKPPHPLSGVLKVGTKLIDKNQMGKVVTISEIDYDDRSVKFDIGDGRSSGRFYFPLVSAPGIPASGRERFKVTQ